MYNVRYLSLLGLFYETSSDSVYMYVWFALIS